MAEQKKKTTFKKALKNKQGVDAVSGSTLKNVEPTGNAGDRGYSTTHDRPEATRKKVASNKAKRKTNIVGKILNPSQYQTNK